MAEQYLLERLALFNPDGNRLWKLMPMGDLHVASTFVEILMKIQMELDTLDKENRIKHFASEIIVDDVLLYLCTSEQLLA